MLKQGFLCALFILALVPVSASALSEPNIVAIEGAANVEEAVAEIRNTLESQGLEIVLTLDHSANAASVGLELAPTTVIFARLPKFAENALLRKRKTVAIDIPLKFLVFERDNSIFVATNSIGYLIDRHLLTSNRSLFSGIEKLQNQFGAPDDGLITLESTRSVEQTALALQEAISGAGPFGIPLVLDYGDRNRGSDGTSPVLIVFGNPNVGTPLMQAQRSIGIDLPQKFLVWKDASGTVSITYNDPMALADRHSIENMDERLAAVAAALDRFATIGAGL